MLKTDLSKAVELLKKGEIIVYPTDTQYALGADIFNEDSIKRVFTVKQRPFNNPIPIAVSSYKEILDVAYKENNLKKIVDFFLPGKLTIILKKKENISNLITSGLEKIAIRIPDNPVALRLTKEIGPLTVTSANIHGEKTQDSINKIKLIFKKEIKYYIDYGVLNSPPSTIIDLTYDVPKLIREGEIKLGEILAVI